MERIELQTYKKKLNYNLAQLELDYYQHLILGKLFEKYNTIYFKGGTALQKCYGIKRFSEDLDFNYEQIPIKNIIQTIEKTFEKKITEKHTTPFGTSFYIKIKGILYDGTPRSECKLSFDFREKDTYNKPIKKIIRPIYADLPNYFILALDEEEILAEKIRAVITRYKARDVYDLNELLINGIHINIDLINKKLATYGKTFNKKEFKEKIEEKQSIYDEEIQRLTGIYEPFETCKKRILDAIKEKI
jgi:predicted nucleotidyltransferase component of viral defense system